ncbi:MAG: hypothetical protein M3297_00100 [Thermoproteota archaeon]|nr:hypothetical protein [Thermoproteota archaeon]
MAPKGDKAYHIMYIADEARHSHYLPLAQKMIDSFEVIVESTVDSDIFLLSSLSTKDYDKKKKTHLPYLTLILQLQEIGPVQKIQEIP